MPLRALRLFPLLNAVELNPATSSSFFTSQFAGSREWSRRAIAHYQNRIPAQYPRRTTRMESSVAGTTSISSNTPRDAKINGNPTARPASNEEAPVLSDKQNQEQCYFDISDHTDYEDPDITPDDAYFDQALNDHEDLYFDPVLNNYEPTRADFFSIEPWDKDRLKHLTPHYLTAYLTKIGNSEVPSGPPVLPIPTNDKTLYHNLIRILRSRIFSRPTLAALLDYHLLFPDHHSVESYNLLISLSIHHRAFGVTNRLFRTMQDRSIQYGTETHRLYVRSFIFKGYWDKAWSYAMQLKNKFPGGSIPFPIWLEFCHARSKGPIIGSTYNPKTKKQQLTRFEPVSLMSARSSVMDSNRPPTTPALKDTPPAAIRNVVQLMVKSGLKHQALKLTENYFRALPRKFDSRMNDKCLDIVKIHLAFNGRGKTPLVRFTAARKLYFSLLSLHPSLRPNSDTLMFILSILKRALRSGTVAWKFISFCKHKWGPEVENRLIRRRVSSWALKEGRMDIVATLLRAEAIEITARRPYLTELGAVGDPVRPRNAFLDRPSVRRIYPRIGREAFMWRRLRLRISHTIKKLKDRGRQVTMRQRCRFTMNKHRRFMRQGRLFTRHKAPNSRFTKRKAQDPQLNKRKAQYRRLSKRKPQDSQFTKRKAQIFQFTKPEAQNPQFTKPKVQDPQFTKRKAQDPQFTKRKARIFQFTKPEAQNPQFTKPKVQDPQFTKRKAQDPQFTKRKARVFLFDPQFVKPKA